MAFLSRLYLPKHTDLCKINSVQLRTWSSSYDVPAANNEDETQLDHAQRFYSSSRTNTPDRAETRRLIIKAHEK